MLKHKNNYCVNIPMHYMLKWYYTYSYQREVMTMEGKSAQLSPIMHTP